MNGDVLNNRWVSFAETSIGYSHIKAETECEDSSGAYSDENMNICVVADGHGSKQYFRTKKGASFAVEAAISNIKRFVTTTDKSELFENTDEHFKNLAKNILKSWNELVSCDYAENPFSEEELYDIPEKYKIKYENPENVNYAYGTTLIAFVVTKNYSFGLQLGDGKCVILNSDRKYIQPIPWDDNCQMNVTTSICDKNALQEFRFYISEKLPIAAFCGTDGIDDSYTGDDDLASFYNGVLSIFAQYGYETGVSEVNEYLPILTKKGSMDDVSVAGIIDMKRAETYFKNEEEIPTEDGENTVNSEEMITKTSDIIVESNTQSHEMDFNQEIGENAIEENDDCVDINDGNDTEEIFINSNELLDGIKNSKYSKFAVGLTVCVGIGILIRLFKGKKR